MRFARKGFLIVLVVLGLVALTALFNPEAASASECGNFYLYAGQITAHGNTTSHTCFWGSSPYYGWAGVDGQIVAPATFPTHTAPASQWHVADWLGMDFLDGGEWIQVGYNAGCIGHCTKCEPCINDQSSLHEYLESSEPGGYYLLLDQGSVGLSSGTTFRVDYFQGCWEAFDHYNALITFWCGDGFATSAAAHASMELWDETDVDGSASNSPATFGTNALGTNQTMRLKGGGGYVDWTSTIPQGTATKDMRTSSPRSTWWSPYHTYWYFITYTNA